MLLEYQQVLQRALKQQGLRCGNSVTRSADDAESERSSEEETSDDESSDDESSDESSDDESVEDDITVEEMRSDLDRVGLAGTKRVRFVCRTSSPTTQEMVENLRWIRQHCDEETPRRGAFSEAKL